jgi:hypothetical protein
VCRRTRSGEIRLDAEASGESPLAKEIKAVLAAREPAGGTTVDTGIDIEWQNAGTNGANAPLVEGVIAAALGRLKHYQATELKCREYALAITKLEEALEWCDRGTQAREARQVVDTHTV